ncbi:MAG TPA: META domain-containing protein [Anaerolineales bacterium]|nr:META domain-containing protein [Anaerolineales bacterium]
MNVKKIFVLIFHLIILSACTPVQPAVPVTAPTPSETEITIADDVGELDGTQWDLAGFGVAEGIMLPFDGSKITLDFIDNQASGSAGCNSYGASYTLSGNSIQFNPEGFVITVMDCTPSGIMDQEMRYMDWLQNAETVSLEKGQLVVHTSEGDLLFEKAQHLSLDNTNWQLSGIAEGDAVVSTWIDEKINITFENGQISGSAGCNRFFAEYTLDGEKLALGVIGATEMACEDEIAQREATFLAALAQTTGYRIERSTLTLLDANGNVLMSFYAGQ